MDGATADAMEDPISLLDLLSHDVRRHIFDGLTMRDSADSLRGACRGALQAVAEHRWPNAGTGRLSRGLAKWRASFPACQRIRVSPRYPHFSDEIAEHLSGLEDIAIPHQSLLTDLVVPYLAAASSLDLSGCVGISTAGWVTLMTQRQRIALLDDACANAAEATSTVKHVAALHEACEAPHIEGGEDFLSNFLDTQGDSLEELVGSAPLAATLAGISPPLVAALRSAARLSESRGLLLLRIVRDLAATTPSAADELFELGSVAALAPTLLGKQGSAGLFGADGDVFECVCDALESVVLHGCSDAGDRSRAVLSHGIALTLVAALSFMITRKNFTMDKIVTVRALVSYAADSDHGRHELIPPVLSLLKSSLHGRGKGGYIAHREVLVWARLLRQLTRDGDEASALALVGGVPACTELLERCPIGAGGAAVAIELCEIVFHLAGAPGGSDIHSDPDLLCALAQVMTCNQEFRRPQCCSVGRFGMATILACLQRSENTAKRSLQWESWAGDSYIHGYIERALNSPGTVAAPAMELWVALAERATDRAAFATDLFGSDAPDVADDDTPASDQADASILLMAMGADPCGTCASQLLGAQPSEAGGLLARAEARLAAAAVAAPAALVADDVANSATTVRYARAVLRAQHVYQQQLEVGGGGGPDVAGAVTAALLEALYEGDGGPTE